LTPILMATLLLFGYFFYRPWENQAQLMEARTQLLTAMILMELANAISSRSLKYPIWKVGAFKNKFLWYAVGSSFILQLIVLYTPGINSAFDVNAPELLDWGLAILFTMITFTTLETAKWIMSIRRKKQIHERQKRILFNNGLGRKRNTNIRILEKTRPTRCRQSPQEEVQVVNFSPFYFIKRIDVSIT